MFCLEQSCMIKILDLVCKITVTFFYATLTLTKVTVTFFYATLTLTKVTVTFFYPTLYHVLMHKLTTYEGIWVLRQKNSAPDKIVTTDNQTQWWSTILPCLLPYDDSYRYIIMSVWSDHFKRSDCPFSHRLFHQKVCLCNSYILNGNSSQEGNWRIDITMVKSKRAIRQTIVERVIVV